MNDCDGSCGTVRLVLLHDDGTPTGIDSGETLADLARFALACQELHGLGFSVEIATRRTLGKALAF